MKIIREFPHSRIKRKRIEIDAHFSSWTARDLPTFYEILVEDDKSTEFPMFSGAFCKEGPGNDCKVCCGGAEFVEIFEG